VLYLVVNMPFIARPNQKHGGFFFQMAHFGFQVCPKFLRNMRFAKKHNKSAVAAKKE
jgi:hypothetical protein